LRGKTITLNTVIISLSLLAIFIAFVASLVAGMIKFFAFRKRKDTYKHILKYAILGEVVGLTAMLVIANINKAKIKNWNEPEVLIAIPVCLMLLGLLLGSIIVSISRPKIETDRLAE
jgi:H+/Cl- antiporter ClcA